MSTTASTGYAYRWAALDRTALLALAAEVLGAQCWSYRASSYWDTHQKPLLTHIDHGASAAIDLDGDFGQAFSKAAELRWRRNDADSYDVLVLTESALPTTNAIPIGSYDTRAAVAGMLHKNGSVQRIEYRTPGRPQVVFVRVCKL
ncbi:hypothetical protein HC891_06290 [Candidatus Gracilibacteria bacterium]|nr:hypothetical protein [Candidatus Gracilibacteria bacterium]